MPRFLTVIETSGPGGNIYEILGKARLLMRQIGVSQNEIETLSQRVTSAPSYEAARAAISEYFPLSKGEVT